MKWKFDYNGTDFTDKLSNLTQVKVFKEIVQHSNKTSLKWSHSEAERVRISTRLRISEITFKRALQGIVKSKLIFKTGRGNYELNPEYVSYGKHGE